MVPSQNDILDCLRQVKEANSGQDIVSLGWVNNIQIQAGKVLFDLVVPKASQMFAEKLRAECIKAIRVLPGIEAVFPNLREPKTVSSTAAHMTAGIRYIIAVGSGKGGVGKSTSAVNLAVALSQMGKKVGLMDADIYGPSVPTMLIPEEVLKHHDPKNMPASGNMLLPLEIAGIKFISMGLLIDKEQPTVWRAPMATKMIQQFIAGVAWGELDYLIIDLPPGTGDVQLTLAQQANLSGAVIITTPQKLALEIAKKGLLMFKHVGVPILGVLETMSGNIFGDGGAKALAKEIKVPLLAEVPLDAALVKASDQGKPIVLEAPNSPSAAAYIHAAKTLITTLEEKTVAEDVAPIAVESIPKTNANEVAVYWSDGMKYVYSAAQLRFMCPCAGCVDEFSGKRRIQKSEVQTNISLGKALPVGRYGVNLTWSDGHSTGIYTYRYLRELEAVKTKERPHA